MMVGSYTGIYRLYPSKILGDDHPFRDIPVTNQQKTKTFRVLNLAHAVVTWPSQSVKLWTLGGTTGLQTKQTIEACGTLSPESNLSRSIEGPESTAFQDMRCRFLAMPILLARYSEDRSGCGACHPAAEAEHIWEIQIGFKERSAG